MKAQTADTAKKRTARPAKPPVKGNGSLVVAQEDGLDRRAILSALTAVAEGDFTVLLPGDWT
jgi:hypothetical protein